MFKYAVKRVYHSWRLFAALLVATTIGTAFFAGVNVSTDFLSRQAGVQSLRDVSVDSYMVHQTQLPRSSWEIESLSRSISRIRGVNGTEIIAYYPTEATGDLAGTNVTLVGIEDNSLVRRGMKLVSGSGPLGADEAYVWTRSPDLGSIGPPGSKIRLVFTLTSPHGYTKSFGWNLTVKGVINLSDKGQAIAKEELWRGIYDGYEGAPPHYQGSDRNILLVSWEATFSRIHNIVFIESAGRDDTGEYVLYLSALRYGLIISVDRNRLVSPYDVEGSLNTLRNLDARIQNTDPEIEYYLYDFITIALQNAAYQLVSIRLAFIGIAIPIFILAWFLGSAASGVTFNLRRREIGLLSARGLTNKGITRLFMTEAALIGFFSGLIGFLIGILVIPVGMGFGSLPLSQTLGYIFTGSGMFALISTLILGCVLAIFTVFGAARRAANMRTISALKEYTFIEDTKKVRRSKLVWTAFILGTYKMIVWILGVNLASVFSVLPANVILYVLFAVLLVIDSGLNYLAPILFLYGAAKLITQGVPWLHKKIGSAGRRAFGEAGRLATRNVQRNLARTATVAFLIALIVGYGVFVVTTSASDNDYRYRAEYASVGADVRADLMYSSNVAHTTNMIRNISGVHSAAYQRSFSSQVGAGTSAFTVRFKAVDPREWLNTAFYESEWFRGVSAEEAFQSLSYDRFTIILDKSLADYLNLRIRDWIVVYLPHTGLSELTRYRLRVVGFFGPDLSSQGGGTTPSYNSALESFVPVRLLETVGGIPNTNDQVIVKLNSDANLTQVVENIQAVNGVTTVTAARLEIEMAYSNYLDTAPQGLRNVGVVMAVVAASLETAIIVLITLHERRREIALLSVRGMSFRQLSSMLLVEIGGIAAMAIILGATLGMIVTLGSVRQPSLIPELVYPGLVSHRIVLPLDSALLLIGLLSLVMLASIIPVLIVARSGQSSTHIAGRVRM